MQKKQRLLSARVRFWCLQMLPGTSAGPTFPRVPGRGGVSGQTLPLAIWSHPSLCPESFHVCLPERPPSPFGVSYLCDFSALTSEVTEDRAPASLGIFLVCVRASGQSESIRRRREHGWCGRPAPFRSQGSCILLASAPSTPRGPRWRERCPLRPSCPTWVPREAATYLLSPVKP